jgi:insulysin
VNPITYLAAMAGLNFSIDRSDNGVAISIEGYSDKAHQLLHEILKKFLEPLSEQNFKKFKEILLRDYQNASKDSPLKQSSDLLKEIIYKNYAGDKSKAAAIRRISFKKYNDFLGNLFKKNYVQGMMYGNSTQQEAKDAVASFSSVLQGDAYPPVEQQKIEVIILPEDNGPFYIESKTDVSGNAALLAIESPKFDFKKRAAQQILMQAMNEPFFAQLRTQQQTGYIVVSAGEEIEKELFDLFGVQSNTHDPRDLLARFELFIEGFLQEIEKELPEERFETFKSALIVKIQTAAKNIKDMGELLNKIAFKYNADFNWVEKRIDSFNTLQYSEFVTLSKEFLGKTNTRRLGILLKGKIPKQNQFSYTRLPLPARIRAMSTFKAGE